MSENKTWSYYYALTGALGGLVGWFIASWALDAMNTDGVPLIIRTLVKGLIIGACIGAAICSRERMSSVGFMHGGALDGLLGMLAGAIGGGVSGIVGLFLFNYFGQNLLGRILGYVLFGAIIGVAEGLKWLKSGTKRLFAGLVGGAVGGGIAALVYQGIALTFSTTIGDGVATVAMGFLLGGTLSFAYMISNMAVLYVVAAPKDKMVTKMLPLGTIGNIDVIGSEPNNSVPFIVDNKLAPKHAMIHIDGKEFSIEALRGDPPVRPGVVMLNGQRLQEGKRYPLHGGELIEAANCVFEFIKLSDKKVLHSERGGMMPETAQDREDVLLRN